MKADNTISVIGKIKDGANNIIVRELEARGHAGLAPSHGEILMILLFQGEKTKTDIASAIGRERSTVTTLLQKLNRLGYIDSRVNEEDARSTIVFLTEKGQAMKTDFVEISEKIYERQYRGMTKKQIDSLRMCLLKMQKNFSEV
jgi:DNA-binding MarR family transcriptional regulator